MENYTLSLELYTTNGPIRLVSRHEVATTAEARGIVERHAHDHGMSHVKLQDDGDCLRFTATTPNNRAGRNIAFLNY